MKCKLRLQVLAAILLIAASMVRATAQMPTGAVDPNTGLPISTPPPSWIDPDWQEPGEKMAEVVFDGLPISKVARQMRSRFTNDLVIIVPNSYTATNNTLDSDQARNPDPKSDYLVNLHLTDSTASEIFRAMNLEFEAENTPVRWQLIMNGHMPTAVLHVMPELLPHVPAPPPAPELKRMVFYVGDLMGSEKSGGMTLQQVRQTVELTYHTIFGKDIKDAEYPEAQLFIVSGTSDDIDFVRQTLEALKQKAELVRKEQSAPAESNTPPPEPTAGAAAGPK